MKVLLDENLPHDLRHFLPGHEVFTVSYMGWSSIENGDLLRIAGDNNFDVIITNDSGVEYEQYLATLPVAVLVLRSKTNKLDDIRPLISQALSILAGLEPKSLVKIS